MIYVDVSSAVHAKAGIGRYAGSLARALAIEAPGRLALFYNHVPGKELPAGLEHLPAKSVRAGYKPWRMAVWLGHVLGMSFNRLVPGAELFHATEHLLPPLKGTPTVLTVHDMIFKRFPEHQKRLNFWYLNMAMPLFCRKADAIITVSESSKRDIVADYEIDPAKITVVYEAAAPEFQPADEQAVAQARRAYGLPEQFLIHVGTIEPRKNLERLVDALERLRHEGLVVPLVVVGAKGWLYEGFFRKLEGMQARRDIHFAGYVVSRDLPALYTAATAAILPSVYEGFGLPLLEAMACGTPILSSTAASLPELGGEAARYFDPYSVEAMATAIQQVWADPELQCAMREKGLERAGKFSWSRAARETLAVYAEVLAARS